MEKFNNKKEIFNIIFLSIFIIIIFLGLFNTIISPNTINKYENRSAYKLPLLKISKVLNKSFQNEVELAFADQIPAATIMKKGYNFLENVTNNILADGIFHNNCTNRYIKLGESTVSYGCDKNIVYYKSDVSDIKKELNQRIQNINKLISSTNIDTFIYYIEKDTDIDFNTNEKSNVFDYLKTNIASNKIYKYEINSFDEFKKYFYKTDHHWNYKGSYLAYTELVNILTNDKANQFIDEKCLNNKFSGTKALFSGAKYFYKEQFCAYKFNLKTYDTYINGKKKAYGKEEYHFENPTLPVTYTSFYGEDHGEVIFDFHDITKENILIIGESYDNALLKLLASHFNKTYSIDLRYYQKENNKKFNYLEYIKENNIDKVLLIGNIDYFLKEEFMVEV